MAVTHPADTLRALLPDLYFVNTSQRQMEHHRDLLARLPQERRVLEFLHMPGAFLTELALCAYDDRRPGLLAKICGTLAALNVSVHTASIFTIHDEAASAPIVLDTLLISESYRGQDRKLEHAKEQEILDTLCQVLDGKLAVPALLKKMPRRPHWPMKIFEVDAEPSAQPERIALTVRVSKHKMAVFRMAAAVASLGLDTNSAQIHVGSHDAQSLFFVTGGIPDLPALTAQLRAALQNGALPW